MYTIMTVNSYAIVWCAPKLVHNPSFINYVFKAKEAYSISPIVVEGTYSVEKSDQSFHILHF